MEDQNPTREQLTQPRHNILSKDPHLFFLDTVKCAAKSYEEAVKLLEEKYSSAVLQTQIKNHFSGQDIE